MRAYQIVNMVIICFIKVNANHGMLFDDFPWQEETNQ